MNEYYRNRDYIIYKKDKWFFIIPVEISNKLGFVSLINGKTVFDLRKMSKKDVLYYLDEINKVADAINKLGYQTIPLVNVDKLKNASQNNDSKEFDKLLEDAHKDVNAVNAALDKCNSNDKTIAAMFNIVMADEASNKDFINWMVANPFVCYSCNNFIDVKKIYEEQKDMVKDKSDEGLENVNLNDVNSMPNEIEKFDDNINTDMPLSYMPPSNATLDNVGLDPTGEVAPQNTTTYIMDPTGPKDNNDITISPEEDDYTASGNARGEQKSKTKTLSRLGAKFGYYPSHNENSDWNKAAFANWYGILLTLIFSFAIGYLIAWILIKVR